MTPKRTTCCSAIGTGKDRDDPKRFRFFGSESYFKSEKEIEAAVSRTARTCWPNTARDRRAVRVRLREAVLPAAVPAARRSSRPTTISWCTSRARARASATATPCPRRCEERLDYELDVIQRTGYAGYFLIVVRLHQGGAAIAAFRSGRGAARPPARWSPTPCGSPTSIRSRFDLLFERFLNPERISMPDIDLDFCFERRGEVIEYVRAKLRARLGRPDHHVRDDEVPRRVPRRGPHAAASSRRDRPHHEADPERAGGDADRWRRRRRRSPSSRAITEQDERVPQADRPRRAASRGCRATRRCTPPAS